MPVSKRGRIQVLRLISAIRSPTNRLPAPITLNDVIRNPDIDPAIIDSMRSQIYRAQLDLSQVGPAYFGRIERPLPELADKLSGGEEILWFFQMNSFHKWMSQVYGMGISFAYDSPQFAGLHLLSVSYTFGGQSIRLPWLCTFDDDKLCARINAGLGLMFSGSSIVPQLAFFPVRAITTVLLISAYGRVRKLSDVTYQYEVDSSVENVMSLFPSLRNSVAYSDFLLQLLRDIGNDYLWKLDCKYMQEVSSRFDILAMSMYRLGYRFQYNPPLSLNHVSLAGKEADIFTQDLEALIFKSDENLKVLAKCKPTRLNGFADVDLVPLSHNYGITMSIRKRLFGGLASKDFDSIVPKVLLDLMSLTPAGRYAFRNNHNADRCKGLVLLYSFLDRFKSYTLQSPVLLPRDVLMLEEKKIFLEIERKINKMLEESKHFVGSYRAQPVRSETSSSEGQCSCNNNNCEHQAPSRHQRDALSESSTPSTKRRAEEELSTAPVKVNSRKEE